MKHTREHDALLDALLAGELSAEDPRARAQLSGCEECARTFDGARNTMKALLTAEERARWAREAAERGTPVPGEERALEFLAARLARMQFPPADAGKAAPSGPGPTQVAPVDSAAPSSASRSGDPSAAATRGAGERRVMVDARGETNVQTRGMPATNPGAGMNSVRELPAEPRRTRRAWTWLALAASVLLVGLLALLMRPAPDRRHELLGTQDLQVAAPVLQPDGALRFEWSGVAPAGFQLFAEVQARVVGASGAWTLVWPAPIAEQVTHAELRERPLDAGAWVVHQPVSFTRRRLPPREIDAGERVEVRWRVVPRANGAANENAASAWSPPSPLP